MWNFKYKNQYLNYVSDLMQDTAVQSMRLLPQHRAGVSCYHHSVLVSYASWRVCDWLGRRLPSGYPPRLPAPGGGPAQRQGPLLPHLAGGGHHPLPHVSLYPHQGVPLPGIGGGEHHGQAVCRRRAGRAGAPAHPLPPGDPLLAGRRLGSYPAAQGRLIPRRMSSEMTDFPSIPAAAAAGALRVFPSGKVFRQTERRPMGGAFFPLLWKVYLTYRPCCAIT